jgi:hypothetical protein
MLVQAELGLHVSRIYYQMEQVSKRLCKWSLVRILWDNSVCEFRSIYRI